MVEWYRVGDSQPQAIELLGQLAAELLNRGTAEAVSYRNAFQDRVGLDPHVASSVELAAAAGRLDVEAPASLRADGDRDLWLQLLTTACVEPRLGRERPAILYDYPASQAALAEVSPDEQGTPVARRFELYVDSIELANGYHELRDAAELRRRNAAVNAQRVADGNSPLPVESRLLEAMDSGLPDCCGVALGFDRLVMVSVGAACIDEVLPFPWERA